MKVLFVAFLALALGASALPQEYFELENSEQRNLVETQIRNVIERLTQWMRDNSYDPLKVNRFAIENSPQPGVDMKLLIEDLDFRGVSNIGISRLIWNTLGSRLRLDLILPEITLSLRNSRLEIDFHGTKYAGELSGDFRMSRLTLTFDIRLNIGIITGISVRSADCTLRIGDLWSKFKANINGEDYSAELNNLINIRILRWLQTNQNQVDRAFSEFVKQVADYLLSQRSITQDEIFNNDVEFIN